MSLFPAFAGLSSNNNLKNENSSKGLDWLSNQSFRTEDALTLHQRCTKGEEQPLQSSADPSLSVDQPPLEEPAEEGFPKPKKKKKDKKKKKQKRKHKKKSREQSESSRSGSDSDSPRGHASEASRLEQETEKLRQEQIHLQGCFVWLDDLQTPTDQPFCVDKKADRANWEYKSLYRGDIARYRRKGNSCLGLNPKRHFITWVDSASEKKKIEKKQDRYFSKAGRLLLSTEGFPVHPGDVGPVAKQTPVTSDFMAVSDWKEEDVRGPVAPAWVNPLGVYDASTTLWLQGKGQPEPENQQARPAGAPGNVNTAMISKVEEFNRKLRENPEDAKTWMEFVSFQDELMTGPSPFTMNERESEKRKTSLKVTLEKKIAILERAIESNPGSVKLKLARLELCKELWEPSTLLKEWKKLIFLHPNNTELWKKYLLFCQSQFSTFSVLKVNSIYGKCLTTLAAVHDGSMVSHPALPGAAEAILEIFLQQCHFLRQAGHSEKVISLFQAVLDFTFFKPDSVKDLPTREQVEFFEPFWDSGEPRFGERGARGWQAWMHQQERGGWLIPNEQDDEDEDIEDDTEVKDRTLPKWRIWLDVEASRETKNWLPWRPDKSKGQSEEDCEDPDRQVLFDDIGPSVIRILKPELRFQLMCSFLQFLGIPSGCSYSGPDWSITLDEWSVFDSGLATERPLTSLDLQCSGVSCIGHMATLHSVKKQIGHCKDGEEFIQNVFHQALPLFSKEEKSLLSLYWLQYEKLKVLHYLQNKNKKKLKCQGKKSKKLAKNLLKEAENRNNLALWKEYAHLEWLLGNLEDSRKVFDTAITLATSQGLQNPALCSLCLLYTQLELEAVEDAVGGAATSRAVHILTKLAECGPYSAYKGQVSPVNILKARKAYEYAFLGCLTESSLLCDSTVATMRADVAVSLVACFALFQYLTVGIEAADRVYMQALEKTSELFLHKKTEITNLWTQPTELETLTLMRSVLLRYHMKVNVYPLGPLRETLTSALKRFPGNHSLWRLYVQTENKYHNASRARRFFDSVTRNADMITPRLFAIYAEQKRKELVDSVQSRVDIGGVYSTIPESGLSNRIRVLFEHAVQSDNGAHCPLLWRMYLHFLVSQGNRERSRGAFYKALQDCPWVKGLYMDAIEYFPDHMQEIMDLMTEKELRVRVPLEELDILLED
ncbi:nuclear exosome regulator NRDE2-like isoform X1 [Acipenser ruthenus]|uniref:nuclear exosome regulator NRDE2-like isoform X1 n=1 Tax=Acipenser ruthenus TaxID=7906 RepID=UPI002740F42A|nr:nuclear exosome regulator NRDE2-like isoform X1 [Acipenser ruthenus]